MINCPYCGEGHRMIDVEDGIPMPSPGDIVVCFCCARRTVFTELRTLRKPTLEELTGLMSDDHGAHLVAMLKRHWTSHREDHPNYPAPLPWEKTS